MNRVQIWVVNDKECDGMSGPSKWYRDQELAIKAFKDPVWQSLSSFEAYEIEGELYFKPDKITITEASS